MNEHRVAWLVCGGLIVALAGCAPAEASPTTSDGGTPPAKRKKVVEAAQPSVNDVLGQDDGFFWQPIPECMTVEHATERAQAPAGVGIGGIGRNDGSGSIGLVAPEQKPRKRQLADCPEHIWTYVGAGHGATPVGNVQAPLGVAATRKERKRTPKTCCYLIPPAPGSPNG